MPSARRQRAKNCREKHDMKIVAMRLLTCHSRVRDDYEKMINGCWPFAEFPNAILVM